MKRGRGLWPQEENCVFEGANPRAGSYRRAQNFILRANPDHRLEKGAGLDAARRGRYRRPSLDDPISDPSEMQGCPANC